MVENAFMSKYGLVSISNSEYFVNDEIMFCEKVEINVDGHIFSYKSCEDRIIINDNIIMLKDILPNEGKINIGNGSTLFMILVIIDPLVEGIDISVDFIKERMAKIISMINAVDNSINLIKNNPYKRVELTINGDILHVDVLRNTIILGYNSKSCNISINCNPDLLQGCLMLIYMYFPSIVNIIMNNDEIDLTGDIDSKLAKLIRDNEPIRQVKRAVNQVPEFNAKLDGDSFNILNHQCSISKYGIIMCKDDGDEAYKSTFSLIVNGITYQFMLHNFDVIINDVCIDIKNEYSKIRCDVSDEGLIGKIGISYVMDSLVEGTEITRESLLQQFAKIKDLMNNVNDAIILRLINKSNNTVIVGNDEIAINYSNNVCTCIYQSKQCKFVFSDKFDIDLIIEYMTFLFYYFDVTSFIITNNDIIEFSAKNSHPRRRADMGDETRCYDELQELILRYKPKSMKRAN